MKTAILLLAMGLSLGSTARLGAQAEFEWGDYMRWFFRSTAGQEIVLDVTNPDDQRWIAFQMEGLRYLTLSYQDAKRYRGACRAVFGKGAWPAGLRSGQSARPAGPANLLCVPDPARLAKDIDWQRRVCRQGFYKRWNGRVSDTQFSCKGQLAPAEVEALARETTPPPAARLPQPGKD